LIAINPINALVFINAAIEIDSRIVCPLIFATMPQPSNLPTAATTKIAPQAIQARSSSAI
jgi:hypothetical protein